MLRCAKRLILAGLALLLVGCSPSALIEKVPEAVGGLPADAPAAPKTPYQYPAVHDMPPPRPDTPLTAEQQNKLEKDLQAARDRLQNEAKRDQADDQNDATPAKKRPKTGKRPQKAGTATNP